MKKVLFFALLVVLLMGWSAASYAQMGGKGMGMMGGMGEGGMGGGKGMGKEMGMDEGMGEHRMMEHMAALGLDDKQMEEIRAMHFKMKKEVIRKKADLDIAKLELKEVLGKDPVDLKAAEAKVKQIEALKAEIKIMHIRDLEDVKAKLTPDQRKKLKSAMEMKHGEGGMGMHGGMGMGQGMMGGCGMMGGMGHGQEPAKKPDEKGGAAAPAPSGHKH